MLVSNYKALLKPIAVGAVTGAVIGLVAFRFLTLRQYPGMGSVLFLFVPIAAGFSIALGAEGMLCAVLAFPIIAAGLFVGLGIGALFRKLVLNRVTNQTTTTGMLLLLAPVVVIAGEKIETPTLRHPRVEVIQTSVRVNGSPDLVWQEIVSINDIKASKPFLMYVG